MAEEQRDGALYYKDLIVLAKKSKKVLNTCALVLRIVVDDSLLDIVDLSTISAAGEDVWYGEFSDLA